MRKCWSIWFVVDRSHKTLPVPRTKGLSGGFAIVTADNNKYFHLLRHHLDLLPNICKKEEKISNVPLWRPKGGFHMKRNFFIEDCVWHFLNFWFSAWPLHDFQCQSLRGWEYLMSQKATVCHIQKAFLLIIKMCAHKYLQIDKIQTVNCWSGQRSICKCN